MTDVDRAHHSRKNGIARSTLLLMPILRVTSIVTLSLAAACAARVPAEMPAAREAVSTGVDEARMDEAIGRLRFLPRAMDLSGPIEKRRARLGTETWDDVECLLSISDEQLNGLAASRDGRRASAAAVVAWQRGDSAILLRIARENIGSRVAAIPLAAVPAQGGLTPVETSLVNYLSQISSDWFGASYPGIDVFDEMYPGYPEFSHSEEWVIPWVRRLERARNSSDPSTWDRVVAQVNRLPELQRIVIATVLYDESREKARSECVELLSSLHPDAVEQLNDPRFLSGDPYFFQDEGSGGERAHIRASASKLMSRFKPAETIPK